MTKTIFSILIIALVITGCASKIPAYEAPASGPEMAILHFKMVVFAPISVGQVFLYSGATCGQPLTNTKILFQRARGNPLLPDINIDQEISIPAGKTVGMRGAMIPGTHPMSISEDANFTPRAGVNYFVRLSNESLIYDGLVPSKLEIFEDADHKISSKDFVPLICPGI